MDWNTYHETVGLFPNREVMNACNLAHNHQAALDLGAGNLRHSLFLLRSGFRRVVAVDAEEPPERFPGIEFCRTRLQEYVPFPNEYDCIVANNVLFFLIKEEIPVVLARAYNALHDEGAFFFTLLGSDDEWVQYGRRPGYDQAELTALLRNFDQKIIRRKKYFDTTAEGRVKFWDVWSVTVTK